MEIGAVYEAIIDGVRQVQARSGRSDADVGRAVQALIRGESFEAAWGEADTAAEEAALRLMWALMIREVAADPVALVLTPIQLDLMIAGGHGLDEVAAHLQSSAGVQPAWLTAESAPNLPPSWLHSANAAREVLAWRGADLQILVHRPIADWRGDNERIRRFIYIARDAVVRLLERGDVRDDYLPPEDAAGFRERALRLHLAGRGDDALIDLDEAERRGLDPLTALRTRAVLLREQGRGEEARAVYDALLAQIDDTRSRAELLFDRALTWGDDDDAALAGYTDAANADPTWAAPLRNSSVIHLEAGRLDAARDAAERAATLEPDSAPLAYNLGCVRSAQGEAEGAIAAFSHALELEPGYVEALNNRGILRLRQGDAQGALADFDASLQLADLPATRARRAAAHEAVGDFHAALRDLDALSEAAAQDPAYHTQRARLLEAAGRNAAAIGALIQTLRLSEPGGADISAAEQGLERLGYTGPRTFPLPASPSIQAAREALDALPEATRERLRRQVMAAAQAMQSGDVETAIRACAQAIEAAPHYFEGWTLLARIYDAVGAFEEAMGAIERALSLCPEADAIWAQRAVTAANAGAAGLALDAIEQAIARFPTESAYHTQRAFILSALDRTDEALDAYREAERLDPVNTLALYNLAHLQQHLGDLPSALNTYTRVLDIDPNDVQALLNRGTAALASGDEPAATADWDEATRVAPTFPHPWLKRGLLAGLRGDPWRSWAELTVADALADEAWPLRQQLQESLAGASSDLAEAHLPAPRQLLEDLVGRLRTLGQDAAATRLLEGLPTFAADADTDDLKTWLTAFSED